jgi:hypothetical protein
MKLLSSRVYPLHLNEKYVGLEELEITLENVFDLYVKAKVFGMIFGVENKFFINVEMTDEGYKYIYHSNYIIDNENFSRKGTKETPSNVSEIKEELLLGEGHSKVIDRISQDASLYNMLSYFIQEIEKKINKNQLDEYVKKYITEQISKEDFIVKEKLNHKILAG